MIEVDPFSPRRPHGFGFGSTSVRHFGGAVVRSAARQPAAEARLLGLAESPWLWEERTGAAEECWTTGSGWPLGFGLSRLEGLKVHVARNSKSVLQEAC